MNELCAADMSLVTKHAELVAEQARLADAEGFLKTADEQEAALTAQLAREQAELDGELRERGERARGPLPPTPAKIALKTLRERREAAQEELQAVPLLIEKIRQRLADDLASVRAAEKIADGLNDDVRKAADLARELLAVNGHVAKARQSLTETGKVAARSWSVDWGVLKGENNIIAITPALLELIRQVEQTQAKQEATDRKARGEVSDEEQLAARSKADADYRTQVKKALGEYVATPRGRRARRTFKEIIDLLSGQTTVEAEARRSQALRSLYAEVCKFAGLEVKPELFDHIEE